MQLYLLIFLYISCVVGTNNQENWRKIDKYVKCMRYFGISSWKIVTPITNATSYNKLNYQWNKVFDVVFPIAIFTPFSVSDVKATVKCGYSARIPLTPNSGGHSFAGLSLGTNDSIVVDFRYMNSIYINDKDESVTLGPGALVGHINAKLWRNGGWGTGAGNCMTVAIGGHAIGGGYGIWSTMYGLVIDNILELKMVNAQGNAVTVNPTQNSDLWWAMRGVGPGYIGLVTSYKLKMFKARDLKVTFVRIMYPGKDFQYLVETYQKWLDWLEQNNQRVASLMSLTNDKHKIADEFISPGIEVHLIHIEDPKIQPTSSEAMLAAYPKYFTNSSKSIVLHGSYMDVVVGTSYSPVTLPDPRRNPQKANLENQLNFFSSLTKDMAISHYSFTESFNVDKQIQAIDLNDVQKVVAKIPKTCSVWLASQQGAIAIPRSSDCAHCAFIHRGNIFNVRIRFKSSHNEDFVAGKEWINEFLNVTRFMDNGHTFQNYPNSDLKDYLHRYYGENVDELIRIKTKWDPKGYFNCKQSIPTISNQVKKQTKKYE